MADFDPAPGVFVLAPLNDDAITFLTEAARALDVFADAEAIDALDDGQRALVREAFRKLDQVVTELHRGLTGDGGG